MAGLPVVRDYMDKVVPTLSPETDILEGVDFLLRNHVTGAPVVDPDGHVIGILTEKDLDTPIDYESLTRLGSMMGSGGMIIMDEDDCVVDIAKFYMAFCVDES